MKVLFIGKIFGLPGKTAVKKILPVIVEDFGVDFVVANGEDASDDGKGIDPLSVEELLSYGIDCITTGEDVWLNKDVVAVLHSNPRRLLRPANYPPSVPGRGFHIFPNGLCVINLIGRTFMVNVDCPFRKADEIIEEVKKETNLILVDFHAQASSEKCAMGWYLDGRVSAVVGSHLGTQTADTRILHRGTGYITDAGVTGAADSICGAKKGEILRMFITGVPVIPHAASSEPQFCAVLIDIDEKTGKCRKIDRIKYLLRA